MKKTVCLILVLLIAVFLTACQNRKEENKMEKNAKGYYEITQEKAKEIMDSEKDILIIDVREEDEYNESHIKGALLLPLSVLYSEEAENSAEELIPDKNMKVLIYCRSGRRSKEASAILASFGYENIYEFGGILTWQYDIVTE